LAVSLIKTADRYIGSVLVNFLALFKGKKKLGSYNRILIVQLWGIGETILALPAINEICRSHKNAMVEVLATSRNADVFYGNRDISDVIVLSMDPFSVAGFMLNNINKFDLVIDMEEYLSVSSIISFFVGKYSLGYSHGARAKLYDLHAEYNDRQHAAETFMGLARKIGVNAAVNGLAKLHYTGRDRQIVGDYLKLNGIKEGDFLIGIAAGAAESAKSRMWPAERYVKLCNLLMKKKKNAKIVLIGGASEEELNRRLLVGISNKGRVMNSTGMFSLRELFCLAEKLDLFIGNDSGPMHIAAAQGVKTIGLFGPNIPVRFGPLGKGNKAVYKGQICKYSPCVNVHKGQVPDCLYPKKSEDYQKCMKNIEVEEITRSA